MADDALELLAQIRNLLEAIANKLGMVGVPTLPSEQTSQESKKDKDGFLQNFLDIVNRMLGQIGEKITGSGRRPDIPTPNVAGETPRVKGAIEEVLPASTKPPKGVLAEANKLADLIAEKMGLAPQRVAQRDVTQKTQTHTEATRALQQKIEETKQAAEDFNKAQRKVTNASKELHDALQRLSQGIGTQEQVDTARKEYQDSLRTKGRARQTHEQAQVEETAARQTVHQTFRDVGAAQRKAKATPPIDLKQMGIGLETTAGIAQQFGMGHVNRHGSMASALNAGNVAGTLGHMGNIAQQIPRAMAGDPTAIIQLAKEGAELVKQNIAAIGGHIKGMGKSADKFVMSDRFEDMGGAAIEGGEHAAKAALRTVGGPVLGPIMEKMFDLNPALMFSKALMGTIGTIRRWGDHLHQANMQFAQFSASMAAVQARQMVRDITLSRERGERRAPSAENLASARHSLNERLSVFEDAGAILKNEVVGSLTKMLDWFVRSAPLIGPLGDWLAEQLKTEGEGFFSDRLREIEELELRERRKRPRHMR